MSSMRKERSRARKPPLSECREPQRRRIVTDSSYASRCQSLLTARWSEAATCLVVARLVSLGLRYCEMREREGGERLRGNAAPRFAHDPADRHRADQLDLREARRDPVDVAPRPLGRRPVAAREHPDLFDAFHGDGLRLAQVAAQLGVLGHTRSGAVFSEVRTRRAICDQVMAADQLRTQPEAFAFVARSGVNPDRPAGSALPCRRWGRARDMRSRRVSRRVSGSTSARRR